MWEGEDTKAKIYEDTGLANKRHCPHGLLHCDLQKQTRNTTHSKLWHPTLMFNWLFLVNLSDWGEIVVCVVGHNNAAKENCHYSAQVQALSITLTRHD